MRGMTSFGEGFVGGFDERGVHLGIRGSWCSVQAMGDMGWDELA